MQLGSHRMSPCWLTLALCRSTWWGGKVWIVALLIGDDTILLPAVRREAGIPRGRRAHLADDPGSLAEEGSFAPYTAFCALDLPASPGQPMPRLRWRRRAGKRH